MSDKIINTEEEKAEKGCCGGHCGCAPQEYQIETGDAEDLQEELMEEHFFLIYHLHLQPSEVDALTPYQRKWLIQRYIHQKKMEKEIMQQMKSANIPSDFLREIERTKNG